MDRPDPHDHGPLPFLHRQPGPAFVRTVITVGSGHSRPFDAAEWRDALVVVECGEIDLECRGGGSRRFGAGQVLWLAGLGLRALHNRGVEPAVLIAVSRAAAADEPGGSL